MALRFIDSFDHYANAQRLLGKWTSLSQQPNLTSTNARHGGQCITNSADGNSSISKVLDAQATWISGAAVLYPSVALDGYIFMWLDSTTLQLELRKNTSGILYVTRNGTTLATGTTPLTAGVYAYIEWKVTIANAGGTVEVKLNGNTEISFTGDTQNTANATANTFKLMDNSAAVYIDDLYICDGTGSAPTNDFLGDCRVEALFPNGNGNTSNGTGSDGNSVDNYLLVDENGPGPNSDTDYVEWASVGDKDTYTFTNLTPTLGSVFGVQMLPFARKTDAGFRKVVSVARLSGTETDSSDKSLSTSYSYYPDIRETKPGGGSWSITDVNNAEFGLKVSA